MSQSPKSLVYSPFRLFCDFRSIRRAFLRRSNRSIYKYGFNSDTEIAQNLSKIQHAYLSDKNRHYYQRISHEFTQRYTNYWGFNTATRYRVQQEIRRFLIVNFGYFGLISDTKTLWVGDFLQEIAFDNYERHISLSEGLTYQTQRDIMTILRWAEKDDFTRSEILLRPPKNSDLPLVLSLTRSEDIRLETMVLLNYDLKFIEHFKQRQHSSTNIFWETILSFQWQVFQTFWIGLALECGFLTSEKIQKINQQSIHKLIA